MLFRSREELFLLISKVDTLVVPEELHEFPARHEPRRSISVRGSTAQPQCLHESSVMVARERDQGGVALHSTTLGCTLAAEELQDAIVAAFEEALTTRHPDAVRRAQAAEILMSRVYGRPVQSSEEVTRE